MKKGDTLFKEQFIILHDEDEEMIIRKSEIASLQPAKHNDELTIISMKSGLEHCVDESVDEIIELL